MKKSSFVALVLGVIAGVIVILRMLIPLVKGLHG